MLKDLAVERFRFSCHGCGHAWTSDYDVQHIDDGHGVTWEYYSLNGVPVTAPTAAGSISCPQCGAGWVSGVLVAVREIPLVASSGGGEDPERPRRPVDAGRQADRDQAPLLPGEQPATDETPQSTSPAGRAAQGEAER